MGYKKVTSLSNPHIKEALKIRERKIGRHHDLLIEGPHLVEMALASHTDIKKVFFTVGAQVKSAVPMVQRCIRVRSDWSDASDKSDLPRMHPWAHSALGVLGKAWGLVPEITTRCWRIGSPCTPR